MSMAFVFLEPNLHHVPVDSIVVFAYLIRHAYDFLKFNVVPEHE
jgi:hypothetical protein